MPKRRRPTTSKWHKHLLVDGYNVIHAWPETKKALKNAGWQAATTRLAEALRKIHDVEGMRVTIVYDGNGDTVAVDQPGNEPTFSLLFTPAGTSADEIMEQIVANSKTPNDITVATRDNMIAESIGVRGAHCISPKGLADWVYGCSDRQSSAVREHQKQSDKVFRNSIDIPL